MSVRKATLDKWAKKFEEADNAEKRVIIARDVIHQIRIARYNPQSVYLIILKPTPITDDLDFQKYFNELRCACCAVGACLLSLVKFTDGASVYDVRVAGTISNHRLWKELRKYFSKEQLALIEEYYERPSALQVAPLGEPCRIGGLFRITVSRKKLDTLNGYRELYAGTKTQRLIQIMKNIIRNNGTFVPEQG